MEKKSGQSETKSSDKIKKEKSLKVHWELYVVPHHQKKQVLGSLKMPTKLSARYKGEGTQLRVIVELFDEHTVKFGEDPKNKIRKELIYEDKVHALSVMRDSASSGTLHARLVLEGKSPFLHCVEPYDGNLADYLSSKKLGISEFLGQHDKIVLPTPNLSSAVSQVVDEIEQLRICGKHHGNFKLTNTYYIINEKGELVLKLSNFKKKTGKPNMILAADWHAVADGLVEIRALANKLNEQPNKHPKLITCQLDGLILSLRNIGPSNAESAFKSIKKQPFFWGKVERKIFFISTIPWALTKKQFVSKVKKATFITLPWGSDGFDGFLDKMNSYRKGRGQEQYNTYCPKAFVQFISGLYTHEKEIQALLRVDVALQRRHPKLCYQLFTLLPGDGTMDT